MSMQSAESFVRDVERFERRDHRRTIAAIGIAIVVWGAAVLSSSVVVMRARRELQSTEARNNALQTDNVHLQSRNELLRKDITRLSHLAGLDAALSAVVKPRVFVQSVAGRRDERGRPIYDFIMFLAVPESRRAEIARVEYIINNPEKLNKITRGGSVDIGYAGSYRGTGCFNPVLIRITTVNGKELIVPFDECAAWAEARTAQPGLR
jgi:hypothetical protein